MHSSPLRGSRPKVGADPPVGACKARSGGLGSIWFAAALAFASTPASGRDSGTETPYPQRACNDLCKYWMSLGAPPKREDPPDMTPTGSPAELGAPALRQPKPVPAAGPPRHDEPARAPARAHAHKPVSLPVAVPIERSPSPASPRADPFGRIPGSSPALPARFNQS